MLRKCCWRKIAIALINLAKGFFREIARFRQLTTGEPFVQIVSHTNNSGTLRLRPSYLSL